MGEEMMERELSPPPRAAPPRNPENGNGLRARARGMRRQPSPPRPPPRRLAS